jgi:hypothetical protein
MPHGVTVWGTIMLGNCPWALCAMAAILGAIIVCISLTALSKSRLLKMCG